MRLPVAAACLFAIAAYAVDAGHPLRGYTPEDSATEVSWEQKFRQLPDRDHIRENMRRLSARPHHVGSPYDKDNAEWLLAQLKSFGLDAKIETFSALFPTPKSRKLELLGPTPFTAKLQEPALSVDPTSSQTSEQLPTYNAYSRDGDVTAPLVYVNYGRPEDYDVLDRMGVSVKGAIVIARYGASWRGIKPKVAAEHGAVGCLIYSDPREDGYCQGDTYPEGPMRPPDGAQRGSVMDMPVYPGDPQTPGVGAVEGVKLIPIDQVQTITKIPVLPISYADAHPFLKALGGETVPEAWRGALPLTYHVGPSSAKAHLAVSFNWDRSRSMTSSGASPARNFPMSGSFAAIITMPGSTAPKIHSPAPALNSKKRVRSANFKGRLETVPHHHLLLLGWRGARPARIDRVGRVPRRRTEAACCRLLQLRRQRSRLLRRRGSHSLENFVNGVAKDIEDPETKMSVWKRVRLVGVSRATPQVRIFACWLMWVGIGSAFGNVIVKRNRNLSRLFLIIIALSPLITFAQILLAKFVRVFFTQRSVNFSVMLDLLVFSLIVLSVGCFLWGMLFTLGARSLTLNKHEIWFGVNKAYALESLGSVAGDYCFRLFWQNCFRHCRLPFSSI